VTRLRDRSTTDRPAVDPAIDPNARSNADRAPIGRRSGAEPGDTAPERESMNRFSLVSPHFRRAADFPTPPDWGKPRALGTVLIKGPIRAGLGSRAIRSTGRHRIVGTNRDK